MLSYQIVIIKYFGYPEFHGNSQTLENQISLEQL